MDRSRTEDFIRERIKVHQDLKLQINFHYAPQRSVGEKKINTQLLKMVEKLHYDDCLEDALQYLKDKNMIENKGCAIV